MNLEEFPQLHTVDLIALTDQHGLTLWVESDRLREFVDNLKSNQLSIIDSKEIPDAQIPSTHQT